MLKEKLIRVAISLLKKFVKKEKRIVYHSFPDFSDNSFAAYVYVSKNLREFKNIWLIDNYSAKKKYIELASNYEATNNLIFVKKKSFKGLWYYLTTEIVFHTHGLYNFLGLLPNQKKINLWHGMPIKKIGYIDNPESKNVQISNFHVATSDIYQKILAKAFGVPEKKVLVIGQTRNDFLLKNSFSIHQLFNKKESYNKTILWMPTYRKSIVGDIRIDSIVSDEKEFFTDSNLLRVNTLLTHNNSICYVKLHPMDYRSVSDFKEYSNVKFIDNESFQNVGVNMYSTFNSIDILLTDFSSIYIDFLLLNKPIGFVFSDYKEFSENRGFLFNDTLEYMPGDIISDIDHLETFLINTIVKNEDSFYKQRQKVKDMFHTHDKNFCEALFNEVLH